ISFPLLPMFKLAYGATIDTKHLHPSVYFFKDTIYPDGIRIREKYLSKVISRYHLHQFARTILIQFIKDVIQQQQGFESFLLMQETILCQFKCNQKRFLLPLGSKLLKRHVMVDGKLQVVFVDAYGGAFQRSIPIQVCP